MGIRILSCLLVLVLLPVAGGAEPLAMPSAASSPAMQVVIKVDGMFCPFCTFGIEKRLRALPETQAVTTDIAAGVAVVTLTPGATFVKSHFADAIRRAGFTHSGITLRDPSADAATPTPTSTGLSAPTSAPASAPTTRPSTASAPVSLTPERVIGGHGSAPGQFDQPMSVAFGQGGWFVVTDAENGRVQQFHPDGRPWRKWRLGGDGRTPLQRPVGLAVAPDDTIWVSDYAADTIHHYAPDGKPLGMFGGPAELDSPSGLAVTTDGRIAVADFYNHRIQLYSPGGRLLQSLGAQGPDRNTRPDGLTYPTRVHAAADNTLLVSDAYGHGVVMFSADGTVLHRFGSHGSGRGQFDVSAGLAVLPNGRIVVADFMNHRVHLWAPTKGFQGSFGTHGSAPGQFDRPTDVALAPDARLYVVDWGNHRLQVFDLRGGK